MTRTPIPNCPQPETPIRERAWTDGQRPEPTYSDAEVDRVAKLIADKCGNGMREKYEDVARTIVESLLASHPSTPDKAGVSDASAKGRIDFNGMWNAMSNRAPLPAQPAERVPEVRLWDTQWLNIVNHDNCYRDWDKEDAINHAVRMTEQAIARNIADGKLPPARAAVNHDLSAVEVAITKAPTRTFISSSRRNTRTT